MLSGTLRLREPGRLIIATGGVGYELFVPLSTYYRMPSVGTEVELEIRQVVREDALLLYGFASSAEKQAFDLLLGIQHVGPKLALAILSVLAPKDLISAISHEDVERIDAVPGVDAKVAERIVRELRDKIAGLKPECSGKDGWCCNEWSRSGRLDARRCDFGINQSRLQADRGQAGGRWCRWV